MPSGAARQRPGKGGQQESGTPGAATSPATSAKAAQKRRVKVYKPIPALDNALTVAFLLECAGVVYVLSKDATGGDLRTLFIAMGATGIAAAVVLKVFEVAGRFVSRRLKGNPLGKPKALRKFTTQSWQLAIHVFFAAWEYHLVYDLMGGLGKNMMVNDPKIDPVDPELKTAYIAQLAVWIFTCMVHRFFDERRKDYFVMYVHHVATIALVAGSAHIDYFRSGMVVLYTHDVSDIAIDLLKMTNYLALQGPSGLFLSEITFVSNLVSWVWFRLYIFPKEVIVASLTDTTRFIRDIDESAPYMDRFPGLYLFCVSLLCLLFCLHCYWLFLLLRIAYKMLFVSSGHEAGREEYEGDSDDSSGDEGSGKRPLNSMWAIAFIVSLAAGGLLVLSLGPIQLFPSP